MDQRERRIVLVLAVFIAATRLLAVAASLFDWDEALFTSAVREYDVGNHSPHPPGYPLYILAAKAVHLFGLAEFRSLQVVVVLGAMALFPVVFYLARAIGFDFATSVGGAAIFAFLPNVWVYGGTVFSDVPAVAIGLAACALLLNGRNSSRSYLLGAILLGVAAGIRPTNLLLGLAPALLATWARWRHSRRVVFAAIVAGALIAGGSYAGAAYASSSPAQYLISVREQGKWVREVDSWRNPGRPALSKAAKIFFLWPVQQRQQMVGLALLGVVSLAAAVRQRRREPLLTLAIFAPMALTSWLNLDFQTASRYAISYMAVHALLAADGLRVITRGRARAQAAACAVVVAVFAIWTWPAVRLQNTSYAPPYAALDWVANNTSPASTIYVYAGLGPQGSVRLRGRRVVYFHEPAEVSMLAGDAWVVDLQVKEGAVNFVWPRTALWKIVRRRCFEASVAPASSTLRFGRGWYGEEGEAANTFRWMSAESATMLPPLNGRGRLAMRLFIPLDSLPQPPVIEVRLNGELLEKFQAVEPVTDKYWITAAFDGPVELVIRTSATVNPARLGKSHDTRELGLRVDTLSWTAVR